MPSPQTNTLRGGPRRTTCRSPGKAAAKAWYALTVSTSDLRGAGTGADVRAMLAGTLARSEPATLPGGPDAFKRGRRDAFR